ncbi:aromatic ring-opening dioxygenase catalytic subunit (LigB family) [Novosphingobium sp. SG751A]|uniref:DODA-type extradiol aromatic ring-opening family dioxygenase n=1 Tax=Novosphingobium sp. SG751A TaxID=2587000 RepID=UPI0015525BAA|nr:2,3-dihydroxyphenylpropionate 1,2-dioxygenase [Novosphingobium sp. SG751A]NOW48897.1 aromatic ring-opening dioxygenase catalytic subunit (LigB family) [Novosphingobium sp. SG751A]
MAEVAGIYAVSHTPVMTNLPGNPPEAVSAEIYRVFEQIGREIAQINPDVMLLISDDHLHNFFLDNMPAFCLGTGESHPSPIEGWLKVPQRDIPGDPAFGAHVLESLFANDFEISFSMELTLDHGMVTPLELMGISGQFPCVPLQVNCVQPPLPRMARCIAIGQAVRRAIESYDAGKRVVVLATGGLSHDVGTPRMGMVNEAFDRRFLDLLAQGTAEPLATYAQHHVHEAGNGAEEIRNWLVAHGIAGCSGFDLYHYTQVSDWYTGIGLGRWRP